MVLHNHHLAPTFLGVFDEGLDVYWLDGEQIHDPDMEEEQENLN